MKRNILTTLVLGLAFLASAQEMVQLLPEKFNDYALNYYLPKTTTEIEFVASKTTRKAGEYYQYARKYLGITDVITEDSEVWKLEGATLVARGVANTEARYQLTFKSGQTPYIYVSKEFTILAANTTPDAYVADTFPALAPNVIHTVDNSKALSGDILMSGSVAKMAEMAAKQIYRIRESRMDILTGEADNMPADGESLRIIIEQLDQQEAALTAMFTGTTSVEYSAHRIEFTPQDNVDNRVVMRFSQHLGFVDANDLSGVPIYLSAQVLERGEYPIDNKGVVKKVPKGAIAYNIPGKMEITLQYNGKSLVKKVLDVAQLGVVFGLDPALLVHKKQPTYVVFDPTTGGIVHMGVANGSM